MSYTFAFKTVKVCKKLRQISVFIICKRLIRKFEHLNYLTHAKMSTNVG